MDNQMKYKQIVKNTRRKPDNKLESQKYFLLTQTKKCGVNTKNIKQKDRQRKKNKTRTLLVFNGTNKEMWSQHEKHEIERQIDRHTDRERKRERYQYLMAPSGPRKRQKRVDTTK